MYVHLYINIYIYICIYIYIWVASLLDHISHNSIHVYMSNERAHAIISICIYMQVFVLWQLQGKEVQANQMFTYRAKCG